MLGTKKIKEFCICGQKNSYDKCCGLYISGHALPSTAEQLMRSRYTAYTQANIAYIQETMREFAAQGFDPVDAEKWAKSVKWKSLKVVAATPHPTDPERYYVQFIVHYILDGQPKKLSEKSEFKKIDGRWYYIAGE